MMQAFATSTWRGEASGVVVCAEGGALNGLTRGARGSHRRRARGDAGGVAGGHRVAAWWQRGAVAGGGGAGAFRHQSGKDLPPRVWPANEPRRNFGAVVGIHAEERVVQRASTKTLREEGIGVSWKTRQKLSSVDHGPRGERSEVASGRAERFKGGRTDAPTRA